MKKRNTSDPAALRQAAEARLKARTVAKATRSEEDLRRLQHELEVHQIELEMQNEELRVANAEIEAGLERYTDLFDFAPIGYFSLTKDSTIRLVNLAGAKLLGVGRGGLIGQRFDLLVAENNKNTFREFVAQVFASGITKNCELALTKPGLPVMHVWLDGRLDPAGECCRIAMTDITERKQLEVESREIDLKRRILETSVQERRRVGHELHDGLGQHLAGVAFKAKVLQMDLAAKSSSHVLDAENIVILINEAIQQTRAIASGLDPVGIEVGGLPAALQQFAQNTSKLHPTVTCLFQCNPRHLNFDKETNLALYRITQESVNNAIQHGQARQIEISLQAKEGKVSLTIRDDGMGFLVEDRNHRGMGLGILSYRANSLGGKLTIQSEVNVGTEIHCLLSGYSSPAT